jgi:hypothetical protein
MLMLPIRPPTARRRPLSPAAPALVLALSVSAVLRSQDGFSRGDVNADASVDLSDVNTMLSAFLGLRPSFVGCGFEIEPDAADVNDNEHFTIADPLYLAYTLFLNLSGLKIPEPRACGADPTGGMRGFEDVDPAFRLSLSEPRLEGSVAAILLRVRSPEPLQAVTVILGHSAGAGFLGFDPAPGLEPDIDIKQQEGNVLVYSVGASPLPRSRRLLAATGGAWAEVGTLRFASAGPGPALISPLREASVEGLRYRISVVLAWDASDPLQDREPEVFEGNGFIRGDADGSRQVDEGDAAALLAALWDGAAAPRDCLGESSIDAGDVNDNEHLTIADYLSLRRLLAAEGPPAASVECAADPDDDRRGFDRVDAPYAITAGDLEVSPPSGSVGRTVLIPINVESPRAIWGVQFAVDYDTDVLTPYGDAEGGPFLSGLGTVKSRRLGSDVLALGLYDEDGDLLPETGGGFVQIGVLRFHLRDFAVFRPLRWLSEVDAGGYVLRASIVDDAGNDHHPELLAGKYRFVRGNANGDKFVDISDAKFTLLWLFNAGEDPNCLDAADSNNDGAVDIADPSYTLNFLFLGGPMIPQPFPRCGLDSDSIDFLGCQPAREKDACFE